MFKTNRIAATRLRIIFFFVASLQTAEHPLKPERRVAPEARGSAR
jgi:hypothetical protein